MRPTLDHLVASTRARLQAAPFRPSPREALLLLGRVLGLSEAQVLARGEEEVPEAAVRDFEDLLARRLAGEPVAYLFGEREFFGRSFAVDPRVLIPRPETEHLVEAALALPLPARPRILDLGTGSGAIAVTLALELPESRVLATDRSPAALAVAAANALRHGAGERLRLLAADWTAPFAHLDFDLVVSNPPYVSPEDAPRLSPEVREFEPAAALLAEAGGLEAILFLIKAARNLPAGAFFACEIGDGQLAAIEGFLAGARAEQPPLSLVEARHDYAGIPRVVVLRRA